MTAKKTSLDDDITLALQANPGVTWFFRLPEEAQKEMLAVRERFHAGGYAAKRYQIANALIASTKNRGWELPTESTVAKWLCKK